jgi:hypothetical protein
MADPVTTGSLVIPEETKKAFSDILALILSSESMNQEERQYWINILPIMSPEQVQNLKDILQNEKSQLEAIDAKYAQEIEHVGDKELTKQTEEDIRKKRQARQQAEEQHKKEEEKAAEDLLKQMDQHG